jgi:DNA topoisomerase I
MTKSTKKKQTITKSMNKDLKLLIVESPAKIKTISKFLGKEFVIMSTFGHTKDLPPKKIGVELDEKTGKISLEYEPLKDKAQTIADICKQASHCDEVYLASDPDREGEIISWHIAQEISKVFKNKENIHRISFNEITKPAVIEAIQSKHKIDEHKVQAQQARRVLDRWVGYEVSPILWKKIQKGLSAGRVQSVALLLVCQREEEVVSFKPEESWSIHGNFGISSALLDAELAKVSNKKPTIKNKAATEKLIDEIKKESFAIQKITEKKRSKTAAPPFMTSTLQQDAYNKLNFSVDKTMRLAQKLYEGVPLSDKSTPEALITYMRTDSLRIADTALKATRSYIKNQFGNEYLPKATNVYAKKGAQDAHEAIRPIEVSIAPQQIERFVEKDIFKLYDLIWKRFVACQMQKAEYLQRQVLLEGGKFIFKATGSTLIFDGFLKVYQLEDESEEKITKIPKEIKESDPAELKKVEGKQHFTQPPPRYTEASLVKEMEKRGVGRPSTYAATLSTIQKRAYVAKEKKRFFPSELGKAVSSLLSQNLPDIINVSFTAEMEADLDKIANGERDRDEVLNIFYKKFRDDLLAFGGKDIGKHAIETDKKCPKCKATLVIRFGKAGEFLGCSKFPECDFTSNFKRNEQGQIELVATEAPKTVDIKCPNCGKNLVEKIGRYGPFLCCPGYPDCKYIHQEALKTPCPKCGGKIQKRKWRGGTFWGCSNYPKCKFAIFSDVSEEPCPDCKSPYILSKTNKDGNVSYTCPNKECSFKK